MKTLHTLGGFTEDDVYAAAGLILSFPTMALRMHNGNLEYRLQRSDDWTILADSNREYWINEGRRTTQGTPVHAIQRINEAGA